MSNPRRFVARKKDANQALIEKALTAIGASIQSIHSVGDGCPDLIVGWFGENYLFEIKSKGGKLEPKEQLFADNWMGQVDTVYCLQDIFDIMGYAHDFTIEQFIERMDKDYYYPVKGVAGMWKHARTGELCEVSDWLAWMVYNQTPPPF